MSRELVPSTGDPREYPLRAKITIALGMHFDSEDEMEKLLALIQQQVESWGRPIVWSANVEVED